MSYIIMYYNTNGDFRIKEIPTAQGEQSLIDEIQNIQNKGGKDIHIKRTKSPVIYSGIKAGPQAAILGHCGPTNKDSFDRLEGDDITEDIMKAMNKG